MQLTEDQVAEYLRANLQFFDRHPALLLDLRLPNPHGQGAISLAERQLLAQRDKARVLEAKLEGFVTLARENDAISDKVHQLSQQLLGAPSFENLVQELLQNLRENFSIPYVGIRLWTNPLQKAEYTQEIFQQVDDELKNWVNSLKAPYCGLKPDLTLDSLFGDVDLNDVGAPESYALVSLGGGHTIGLLALASNEKARFFPEMGTLYLKRIGELVSAALLRYLAVKAYGAS
jgi:uncharacterized protein YigA (DUF484 family)